MTEIENQSFLYHLLLMISIPQLGPRRIKKLVNLAGSPEKVFRMPAGEILKIPGFNRQLAAILKQPENKEFAEKQIERLQQGDIGITHLWASDYPRLLKEISDPPVLLWYRGDISLLTENLLAIVGTRRATSYGKQMTERITRELVEKGIGIVSGMARGIDSIAHWNAVKFGGLTIAVVASGADVVYPPDNTKLAEEIATNGIIFSEFPAGTEPEPAYFFRRNRIISGLSKGVIVTEAGHKSGALITAAFAAEQNRELFALPGPVNAPQSAGCLRLIQEGAKLIVTTDDILNEFPAFRKTVKIQPTLTLLTEKENIVYTTISNEPVHVDALIEKLEMGINELNNILLNLELEGYITQLSGKMFIRS